MKHFLIILLLFITQTAVSQWTQYHCIDLNTLLIVRNRPVNAADNVYVGKQIDYGKWVWNPKKDTLYHYKQNSNIPDLQFHTPAWAKRVEFITDTSMVIDIIQWATPDNPKQPTYGLRISR